MLCYHLYNLHNQHHLLLKINHIKRCWIKEALTLTPWGNPNKMSSYELYTEFIMVICLQFLKKSCTNLSESIMNLYAFDFAIKRSCERQSNALERFARGAPNLFWLSTANFHFVKYWQKTLLGYKIFPKTGNENQYLWSTRLIKLVRNTLT